MDKISEMNAFVKERVNFTVPMLQRRFEVSYKCASDFVNILEREKTAKYLGGISYCYSGGAPAPRRIKEGDELYARAVRTCIEADNASVSLLQRKMTLDFSVAAQLIYRMEKDNYISVEDGCRARKVLISKRMFEEVFGMELKFDPFAELRKFVREQENKSRAKQVQRLVLALKNIARIKR